MTTRREPSNTGDDTPVRVVAHRLQRTDVPQRAPTSVRRDVAAHPATQGGPAQRRSTRPPTPANGAVRQHRTLRQIILVDRDIDALRDVAIALRDEYDFHITISGAEAINLLRGGAIDTIVVGQTLYSSTGLNVLAEARRHAPGTHRVLLASVAEAAAVEGGAAAVAPFRLLQRPCTADRLRELLEADVQPLETTPTAASQHTPQRPMHVARPDTTARDPLAAFGDTHDPADFEHVVLESPPELPRRRAAPSAPQQPPPRPAAGARQATSQRKTPAPLSAAATVPVTIFTDNGEFYHAIATALQDRHEVRLCTQIDRLVGFAELGQCPIVITDRAATQAELQRISIALRAFDADIVTIVAGPPEVGAALRKLLGTGALHSFMPKPINPPLVRLVVESAKRHFLQAKALKDTQPELRTVAPPPPRKSLRSMVPPQQSQTQSQAQSQAQFFMPSYRDDFSVDNFSASHWRPIAIKSAAIVAIVAAIAGGGWYGWQWFQQARVEHIAATAQKDLAAELVRGDQALAADRITTPSDDSALYHYSQALKLDPDSAQAQAGIDATINRVIAQAEQALTRDRLDVAADAIATVRAVQPRNKRLPYLEDQLARERHRATASATATNRLANIVATPAAKLDLTQPISNENERQQFISRWLSTARLRLAQGELISPDGDSAEYYFRQVDRADPGNVTAANGLTDIAARLLTGAQQALDRQQLTVAKQLAHNALRLGADSASVDAIDNAADAAAESSERNNLLRLVLQRARENRLLEPERDSAKYYLDQLQSLGPNSPEATQALRAVALKLIDNADQTAANGQINTAAQILKEVRRLGYNGGEIASAEARLRAPQSQRSSATETGSVAQAPKLVRSVSPKYPDDAMRANAEGWVDVRFAIEPNGDTANAQAIANSGGNYAAQFERAAVNAISQYKFEPRRTNAQQLAQNLVVRVQFKLE